VRLSVCLGARLHVQRLFDGADDSGDCGAGRDFVSITPDRRVQSCSFQDESFPIETASDVLRVWAGRRDELSRASSRHGCARAHLSEPRPTAGANVRVWQAFSGNNSGECIMVARFATVADAEKYLAELAPGFVAGEPYSPPWQDLFAREGVAMPALEEAQTPDELVGAGRAVFARVHQAPDDAFPELRALAWKRGGEVLAGGIHEHDAPSLLFVIRTSAAAEVGSRVSAASVEAGRDLSTVEHGDLLLGAMTIGDDLPEAVSLLQRVARDEPIAQEIWCGPLDRAGLEYEAKRLAVTVEQAPRMALTFWAMTPDERNAKAEALALKLSDRPAVRCENTVVAEAGGRDRKRLALLGHRSGAIVQPLLAKRVIVHVTLWEDRQPKGRGKAMPPLAPASETARGVIEPRLRAALGGRPFEISCDNRAGWSSGVTMKIVTDAPRQVFDVLAASATEFPGASMSVTTEDTSMLALALRRLIQEARSR
jgi:hypothetical protein